MSRALRILVAAAVFFGGVVSLLAAENAQLARGTAITDPDLLRELDQRDALTISRLLWPERNADFPLTTDLMFSWLPQLKDIPPAIDAEIDRYIARQKAAYPTETIGVGEGFDVQLFDRCQSEISRHPLRAGRHRQPHGPRLCLGGLLRRDQADLSSRAFRDQAGRRQDAQRGCR